MTLAAADEVERRIREEFPEVRHVFLDPTPGDEGHADTDRPESGLASPA